MISLRSEQAPNGKPGNPSHFCGGSLISERVIITAAHCCTGLSEADGLGWSPNFTTSTGTSIRNPPVAFLGSACSSGPGAQSQPINFVIVHPLWRREYKQGYDICIMFTTRPFTGVSDITPKIATSVAYSRTTYRLQSAGWGSQAGGTQPSPILRALNMTQVPTQRAKDILANQSTTLHLNQLMVTSLEGSTCQGDSGGPLIYSPSDHKTPGTDILLGIVSYGTPACAAGEWSVMSDITAFVATIPDNKTCSDLTDFSVSSYLDAFLPCTLNSLYADYNFSSLITTTTDFFAPSN